MNTRLTTALAVLVLVLSGLVGGLVANDGAGAVPNRLDNRLYREYAVDSANVITADEATTAITGFAIYDLARFYVSCVEDSGTATLDPVFQVSIDGGTTWVTMLAMTQLSATGAETKIYSDLRAATTTAQMMGNRLRLNWDVTGTGQFTCSARIAAEG